MGNLSVSVEGIAAVEADRLKRKQALTGLTAVPFDIRNIEQIKAIKKYTQAFELSVNKMYLFHGMSEGASIGGGSWILGFFLPIPYFAKYLLTSLLYIGIIGFVLERFSLTDFYDQLNEMRGIYDWALKDGLPSYSPRIDNNEKLQNPVIQDLVKTIAPMCTVDFLLAWPRQTTQQEVPKTGWYGAMSVGASAISTAFFSQKPNADLKEVKALELAVETRAFDIGVLNGFKQAISYFASTTDYGALLNSSVGMLKEMLPSVLSYAAH